MYLGSSPSPAAIDPDMLNFFTKALIKNQLKGVPQAELDKIFALIEKNPDFFKKLAVSVQEKTKSGMSQQDAMKEIMEEEGDKIKELVG